jgi:predicted acyltransferase (DUF342 family)
MWIIIFSIVVIFLILLPLIPALIEFQFATDTKPLRVTQDYDSNIKHFAAGFKSYIEKNFANLFSADYVSEGKAKEGVLRDNTPFVINGVNGKLVLDDKEIKSGATIKLIVSEDNITLPDNILFESEIYGRNSILTGINSRFRAILAENDIILSDKSVVFRWVHSGNILQINNGCKLFGRASADNAILIAGDCEFERLQSAKTIFGKEVNLLPIDYSGKGLNVVREFSNVKDRFEKRWLITGNLEIPANSYFDGDIIATKKLTIGAGSIIKGSVKGTTELVLEENVVITGSAVSANDIETNNSCRVFGQLIAEGTINIGNNNIIGSLENPVTVTAACLKISNGVTIFGSIRADEKGYAFILNSLKNV